MKLAKKWKQMLLYCVLFFFILLAVGYALHNGVVVVVGGIVMCLSAVVAERGLRCPACHESVFKQAMERGANTFICPKCGQEIELE